VRLCPSFDASLVPSSLALIPCYVFAESDFYATEAGREHFANQLKSIRYWYAYSHEPCFSNVIDADALLVYGSVQETCNFDVLYAYLTWCAICTTEPFGCRLRH